jgi:translation initiation factor 2 subunit 1
MLGGDSALTKIGVSEDIAKMITQVANDNLKKPQVDISGYINLTCPNPDGIEVIRKALIKADEEVGDDIKVDVSYVGAPRYRIRVIAPDYKKAESVLKKSSESAIKIVQKAGGTGEFFRNKEPKT